MAFIRYIFDEKLDYDPSSSWYIETFQKKSKIPIVFYIFIPIPFMILLQTPP